MPEAIFKNKINEVAENATRLNCKIVGDFVLEPSAAKSAIATNKILKDLGDTGDILPVAASALKK
jgi:hypothetical protein